MTVKELKELIKNVPDEWDVLIMKAGEMGSQEVEYVEPLMWTKQVALITS